MDTNALIMNTMIVASVGFVTNTATIPNKFLLAPTIEYNSILSSIEQPSSTRLTNSQRFSLDQLKNNKQKLRSFKNLQENWNGYGGKKFEISLITKIEKLLSEIEYQPQIFPTGRGTIQIEKFIDEDNLVEIEVSIDEIFAYKVKNGIEEEKEISLKQINELISELYA